MNADGTNAHQVTLKGLECRNVCPEGAQDNQAGWSPDGNRIVFLRDRYTTPETYAIFTIGADGSDLQQVTPWELDAADPDWSPDGNLIVFNSPAEALRGGEQNIFTIHPDGTGLTQLTAHLSSYPDGGQGTFHPSWSPDGTQILFTHIPSTDNLADFFVMDRDGSGLHVLAETRLNENHAFWGGSPS